VTTVETLPEHRDADRGAVRRARQSEALKRWAAVRAAREQTLRAMVSSRESRMDTDRRLTILERADRAVHRTSANGSHSAAPATAHMTAVIAHRHDWFVGKIADALAEHGVAVVAACNNGADALGTIIAEQPDLVLVGDALAMLTSEELIAEVALLAPQTVVAAQVGHGDQVGRMLDAGARTAFTRQVPPAEVAAALAQSLTG
jgi:hypothetical protein